MAISKEQWAAIVGLLSGMYRDVKFRLPTGEEIRVNKMFIAENKAALIVWVDGVRNEGWGWPEGSNFRPVVKQIWRRKTYRPGARLARQLSKQKGGKALLRRKAFRDLNDAKEYWVCYFNTAASLVCQFKKIDGLELVVGSLHDDDFLGVSE
ncbi:TPA: hypothetical protein ACXPD2_000162 [Klebsiella pneumoniae]|uniref:hypothetical protein n=1 Tax=Klebsiella pneumoniae TaxID=573 RepID=UPI001648CAC5|nr:hypothetical protein [Klebsiella pneumoniae]EKW2891624.1 hypothetical protein [Klebsiella pneumoniae]ELA0627883.1 hypothetical protein [Klebsiella pneumoniae]MBC4125411.1 hypothetical protein [Klebsiella pneumoniae]MBX4703654.1 hypothetical protein [Klebsiella pneumoniae]MCD9656171.1 hypothetical protein [Klebsiella pneumoniae]